MKKSIAFAATVLASASLLTACGQKGDFDGTWSGDVTATEAGQQGGTATINIDGKNCSWDMTEASGENNSANCLRDDKEFKLEDPLTHKDLKYTAQRNGDTLTLTPENKDAEKVGVMVLTKTADK